MHNFADGWRGIHFLGKGNGTWADGMWNQSDMLSVVNFLKIAEEDMLAYEWRKTEVFRPSYFIARDRATNSIVLSIRGTMSTFDTMTDLACEYEQWKGGLVHSGWKASAQWFLRELGPTLIAYANIHSTTALYIVGHSLGSGIAALLTIMLLDYLDEFRKNEQSFEIKGFGYAPTCAMSLNLSEKYKDNIQSFVFADDIVSKLSYGSMLDVKEMLLASAEAAQELRLSKIFWTTTPEGEEWEKAFEGIAEVRRRCLESNDHPRVSSRAYVVEFDQIGITYCKYANATSMWLSFIPALCHRAAFSSMLQVRFSNFGLILRQARIQHALWLNGQMPRESRGK